MVPHHIPPRTPTTGRKEDNWWDTQARDLAMKLDSVPTSSPISGPHLFSAAMGNLKLHLSSPFWSFPPPPDPYVLGWGLTQLKL